MQINITPRSIPTLRANSNAILRAIQKSIRLTLKDTKSDAASGIKQRYTNPSVGTRPLKIKVSGLTGELSSKGAANPLEKFKINPRKRLKRPPKRGVFAQVVRGQGGFIGRAFIYNGAVFERIGKRRLPIRHLKTVSAPGMLKPPPISNLILGKIQQRFDKHLAANLESVAIF